MNLHILPEFCGDTSPLLLNFSDDNDQNIFLSKLPPPPQPKYMTAPELLHFICGPWDGVATPLQDISFYFSNSNIVQWLSSVDQYLDVPIIQFLVKYKLDYDKTDWWLNIGEIKGWESFLNRFTLDLSETSEFYNNVGIEDILLIRLVKKGHLHILKYLESKGIIIKNQRCDVDFFLREAIINSNSTLNNSRLDMVKWLMDHGASVDYTHVNNAVLYGHLDVLKWFINNGSVIKDDTVLLALRSNSLNILQWMVDNRILITEKHLQHACSNKAVNTVDWITTNFTQIPITESVLKTWITNNNVSQLNNYTLKGGKIRFNSSYEILAFKHSNVETLEWLNNNCDKQFIKKYRILDKDDYSLILSNPAYLDVTKWLVSKGIGIHDDMLSDLVQQICFNKEDVTKLIETANMFGWDRVLNSPDEFKMAMFYKTDCYKKLGKFIMDHKCVSINQIQDVLPKLTNKGFWSIFIDNYLKK